MKCICIEFHLTLYPSNNAIIITPKTVLVRIKWTKLNFPNRCCIQNGSFPNKFQCAYYCNYWNPSVGTQKSLPTWSHSFQPWWINYSFLSISWYHSTCSKRPMSLRDKSVLQKFVQGFLIGSAWHEVLNQSWKGFKKYLVVIYHRSYNAWYFLNFWMFHILFSAFYHTQYGPRISLSVRRWGRNGHDCSQLANQIDG